MGGLNCYIQVTTDRGRRCSAANAFLDPIVKDDSLTVVTHAKVQRVLMDAGRAVGVEYMLDGLVEQAFCEREVILTAAAYNTPKILMLSGIGPADHLREHGIDVEVDLPGVGRNMQDHNMAPIFAATRPGYGYFGQDQGLKLALNALRYGLTRSGPLASNGSEALAFVNLDDLSTEPHLQLYCIGSMPLPPEVGKPDHGIMLCAGLVRPKSRGWRRMKSADPADDPEISPNYFEDPEDLALMVRGMRYLREILGAEPLASIVRAEMLPGPDLQSDEALAAYCRQTTFTNYHPVGSCGMGPDNDPMAVVDPQLRVRGVQGLRIFDASVISRIPSANTNAPVMAIADRGVDLMTGRAFRRAAA